MNQNPNMTGLAGLLASQGRGEDKVLVHMTPGEVQGLQGLAMATGGSLTTNPNTGLPEAGWLKKILPAIAGFTLNRVFPGLGSTATSAIVGGATGLIEGSFKKGLNAGFSAYSGANISEGLRRSAAVRAAPPTTLAQQLGLKEDELLDYDLNKPDTDKQTFGVRLPRTTTPLPAVSPVTPQPSRSGIFEGIKGLTTEQGRKAFASGLEGGYTNPFGRMASKYATGIGLQNIMTPDYDDDAMKKGSMTKPRYYIPGDYNPNYGKGYGEWIFKPGFFTDKYPGYADGGMVLQDDERFANGGEVMVSPDAVLPQRVTTYQPSFTQDRDGLQAYYESLLVPPNTTPRDTSALKAYLDALQARLRQPYQPYGTGSDGGGGGAGGGAGGAGGGGGGGTSPTPGGTDPYATGVTGTPAGPVQPPAPPTYPDPREPLTPPGSVAPNARPEDLGFLFGIPGEFPTDPPPEDEKKPGIEITAEPGTTAEDYTGQIGSISGPPGAGGLPPVVSEPEDPETETSIEVFDPKNLASDYTGAPASVGTPGAGGLPPTRIGNISYRENPAGYDFVNLGFINPQTPQEVADATKSVVDDILKAFEEQQKAEKEGDKETASKAAEAGTNWIEQLAKLNPKTALLYEAYKYFFKKEPPKEKEATYTITEVPDQPTETPQTTTAPSGGGSAIPWTSMQNYSRNYTIRDLINPVEDGGGTPTVTVEEMGMASGGAVPRFAQGGLGSLQQYAVGGKLVNGAGDGMSDDIKANINGTQEARLADGEFVIPADVVSHLGNGSTDAGAKQLYAMMDRIRGARTGRNRQAPEVNPRKLLPA